MRKNNSGSIIYAVIEIILDYSIMFASIFILLIGLYFVMDSFYINSGGTYVTYQKFIPFKSPKTDKKDFKQLSSDNPDVIAWITIKGTGIDYPVLLGETNDEYLFKNEKGEYASSGSIFIDSLNDKNFCDFNTIIYGHHMQYGSMFGDIEKFKEEKIFKKNKSGSIYYNNKEHTVEFFAFIDNADGYDFEIYNPGISNETDKAKYIDNLLKKAKYTRKIVVDTNDRIVLLSTCNLMKTNGRYILVGKFVDERNPRLNNKKNFEAEVNSIQIIRKLIKIFSIILLLLVISIIKRRRV